MLLDAWVEGEGFKMASAYKVRQSPTFILIDGKGVIAGVWQRPKEMERLQKKCGQRWRKPAGSTRKTCGEL